MATAREHKIALSIVIPLFNEAESLPELIAAVDQVCQRITPTDYEILAIDDGSTDNSFAVLQQLLSQYPRLRIIRFRRNYGKSAALAVGFQRARGDVVITMDADLQDDPEEIPRLLQKLNEGYDLVSGWKKKRYDPWHKTLPSKLFNWVTSIASGIRLHDFNCGLKAYRREVVKHLHVYGEMHRYLPALAHLMGFRVTEIPVRHHPRKYGRSKFGAGRFIKGFLDLLTVVLTTRFARRPLHFFGAIGILMATAGFFIDAYLTVEWLLGKTFLSNRPLALLGVALIIVGVQFISLGLLAEMIVQQRAASAEGYLIEWEGPKNER